jgi:toxin ParE1/3/4
LSVYILSPEADADLEHIYTYTLDTWGKRQLVAYEGLMGTALDAIADNPNLIGHKERFDLADECYLYHVGHHIIAYRQKNWTIEIIRVLHERMDISAQLQF